MQADRYDDQPAKREIEIYERIPLMVINSDGSPARSHQLQEPRLLHIRRIFRKVVRRSPALPDRWIWLRFPRPSAVDIPDSPASGRAAAYSC